MPICMFFGFGRFINLRDIKTRYMYVALGQELLIGNIPLLLLQIFNNTGLSKQQGLDTAAYFFSSVNILMILAEYIYFRINLNMGVNLEQRVRFHLKVRLLELVKIFSIAACLGGIFLGLAFAFKTQHCYEG